MRPIRLEVEHHLVTCPSLSVEGYKEGLLQKGPLALLLLPPGFATPPPPPPHTPRCGCGLVLGFRGFGALGLWGLRALVLWALGLGV